MEKRIEPSVRRGIKRFLSRIEEETDFDFANDLLYNLCRDYPGHEESKVIFAKAITIGRTYAAALERNAIKSKGKKSKDSKEAKALTEENFYFNKVIPLFKKFFRGKKIKSLIEDINHSNSRESALRLQSAFSAELKNLKKGSKTSFSSKYLHFHFRESFFMYDSRAKSALPYLKSFLELEQNKKIVFRKSVDPFKKNDMIDKTYFNFENRCYTLKAVLEGLGYECTNRQFDNLLLHIASIIK